MRRLGVCDLGLMEQLFEQLPDCPFFAKDADLRYVAANAAMARLCGVRRPRDLYGRTAAEMFEQALARRYEALDRAVLAEGRAMTNKLELSGGLRAPRTWLLFSRAPIHDAAGAVVGVAASARQLRAADHQHPTYDRIARIAERLREDCGGSLRLDVLAAEAGVSKSQLERDFMRIFGLTPLAFLQQARIDQALRLLETDMSVAQIAYACGYADHSAFTRRFREIIGCSPREMRRASAGL